MAEDAMMQEGKAPFAAPSVQTPCFTYYKIFGDLQSATPPLLVLHGGPGVAHYYTLPFKGLWALYGIPVVLYDQIGCGSSTRLPHTIGDTSFWKTDLFIAELENLLNHLGIKRFDLLGHSWGGRVTADFASRQPPGLRRLVLFSTSADGATFYRGLWELKKQLSIESQQALDEAAQKDDFTGPAYLAALADFRKTFLCRADPWPEELIMDQKERADDPTVRVTLQGRSPWSKEGPLKTMSCLPFLSQISVPTLVLNGEFDTNQYESTAPLFELIPKVKWVTIAGASHMPFLDSKDLLEKTLKLISTFLKPQQTPSN